MRGMVLLAALMGLVNVPAIAAEQYPAVEGHATVDPHTGAAPTYPVVNPHAGGAPNPHAAGGRMGQHRMRYMGHSAHVLTDEDAAPDWISFEAGPNVLTRGTRTSFGPQFAFTPIVHDGAVLLVPRLEVQFNRTAMNALSPVVSVGGEALVPFSGFNLYAGPGAAIARTFSDGEQSGTAPSVSGQVGWRVKGKSLRDAWNPVERIFMRYTAILTSATAHQVTAGVGFALR